MNLGMDFGSTYTIISTYREDQERLEAIAADCGEANINIPSVLSLRNKNTRYGSIAKRLTGKKNARVFKAFKMLLMEENQKFIEDRQYDMELSPQWAAKEFLNLVITESRIQNNADKIDNLVIGAPDLWFHSFNTLSGRALLRDICGEIEGVRKDGIRIVSEPVLASAYFAFNFMKKRNRPFEGAILIVDYGGGTLDLSLAKVDTGEKQTMEIRMLESNGAGENTDHSIGKAGIVYMESLMEYVIRKNTPDEADELIGTPAFYDAVNALESELFAETDNIESFLKDYFDLDDPENLEDLDEEIMGNPIECGNEEYDVTFADLINVYNFTIREVFDKTMEEIIGWAKTEDKLDLLVSDGDKFKIALVGGFSNFYLVKKQMREKFHFNAFDEREKDIIETKQDRERAISYGAALIASNVIGIRNTAPYSIGVQSTQGIKGEKDYKENIDYMVRYREEVTLDKALYAKDSAGNYKVFVLSDNKLDDFVIDYGRANGTKIVLSPKPEFKERLSDLVKNICHTCYIGVSFSGSDVLNLHIREYYFHEYPQRVADTETIIELGQFNKIFEKR